MRLLIIVLVNAFLISSSFAQQNEISLLSWNIRDFGKSKSDETIEAIANIVKDYDILAIQEVVAIDPGGVKAVARLVAVLNRKGSKWDYRISDPTTSPGKKMERYAYIWKTSKVKLKGRPWLEKSFEPFVYREPYLAYFLVANETLLLANYHSRKHNDHPEEELPFLLKIKDIYPEDNIIIAGDFNLFQDHASFIPFFENGFNFSLKDQKTTLKMKCGKEGAYLNYPIDNILYKSKKCQMKDTGVVDFIKNCERLSIARKLSDHLAIWSIWKIGMEP